MRSNFFSPFILGLSVLYLTVLPVHKVVAQSKGDLKINGRVVSFESGEGIPYAAMVNIDDKRFGTTTNNKGEFKLELKEADLNHLIHFTSLGYKDTTIRLDRLNREGIVVKLIPKIYQLADFEVASERRSEGRVGDEAGRFLTKNQGISMTTPGLGFAAWLKAPKRVKNVMVESIKVFLSEQYFDSPFTLRVLAPKDGLKIKETQMHPLSSFKDLLNETKLYQPTQSGWFEIDLSEQEVAFSENGIFIVIGQIDSGEKYQWKGSSMVSYISLDSDKEKRYGHMIGIQKRQSKHKIFDAMYTGDRLGVVEGDNFHGALVVYYSYQ
jgi:hypothetical protein